jgi:hypothetical protein
LLAAGAWDDALTESEAVLSWAGDSARQHASLVTPPRAYILALRGDAPAAGATLAGALDRARKIVDPQIVSPTLTVAALLALIDGDPHKARNFAIESSRLPVPSETALITEMARVLIATGAADQARPLADDFSEPTRASNSRIAVRAMLAESDGDTEEANHLHAESARRWRSFGHRFELAHALAGRARCLRTIGNNAQAEPFATEATSLFRVLGVDEHVLSATGWPLDGSVSGIARP